MQHAPNLDSAGQLAVEDQITPKASHAPGADLRPAQVGSLAAYARVASKKFKAVINGLQEGTSDLGIVAPDESSGGLEIAEDELALLPARVHSKLERTFLMFE